MPADAKDLEVFESSLRVETFVTVGKPSAITPSGKGLELAPVTHPNDLAPGEPATFAMHLDGQPAAWPTWPRWKCCPERTGGASR